MDEQENMEQRPVNPRRRKRSRQDIFKEVYLPPIIASIALVLIAIFIIGSVTRSVQRSRYIKQQAQEASIAAQAEKDELDREAAQISAEASRLASQFDYPGAIDMLQRFSGDIAEYPDLSQKLAEYTEAASTFVLWNDPASVLSLSFHVLIEDGQRAFTDATYGASYNRNFITTEEFRTILQQLYENNYILVSLEDITVDGSMELYLPENKKPLLLTQTNVNYYNYMTDSDGDKLPDAAGDGFASKLILDANGNITCQMTDAQGQTVTGAFDMVPILESFIETHPDFSYRNAKAVLAITGYDGVFGYRTNPAAKEYLGEGGYELEIQGAVSLCEKLRSLGYEIACYTYGNESYGALNPEQITQDLEKWSAEVTPIIGQTNILVFAQSGDIDNPSMPYSGEKAEILQSYGFNQFLGFCEANESWHYQDAGYMRMGRILITGTNLAHHGMWFEGFFDAAAVLDPNRADVPA